MGRGRMDEVRAGTPRQVLPAHAARTDAARGGNGRLAAILHRRFQDPAGAMTKPPRTSLWNPPVEQEVDEELTFHLEMHTRDLIASGMDPAAAREAALRRLGDLHRLK